MLRVPVSAPCRRAGVARGGRGLALLLALSVVACRTPSPELAAAPPENVLLITVDTLRADTLGFAGHPRVRTPTLDRLARQGRAFTFAHAHNVMTLPSHANILTGLYPYQHGVRNNGGFALPAEIPTMATLLGDAGFATAAVIAAYPLASRYGLARGFDLYDEDFDEPLAGSFRYSERRGDEVVAEAVEWWTGHAARRRFLWLHLFDPHVPYEPPAPFDARFPGEPYLGEVEATDAFLEPLLAPFLDGRQPPTLIIFTSDHGEALGEHREETHGIFAYEGTLRVPLVLWGPGIRPGADERPARHIDLLPTVLDRLELPPPADLPGSSLATAEDAAAVDRTSYFESLTANFSLGWAPLRGVLAGRKKLIELPEPELYLLDRDPGELDNVFTREASRDLVRRLPQGSDWPPEAGALSAEEVSRLQSLGYLAGEAPRKESYGVEDDPKRLIHLRTRLNRAVQEHLAGRHSRAIALVDGVLRERPDTPIAYSYLSSFHLARGDRTSALAVMQRAVDLGMAQSDLRRQLGLTLVTVGRAGEALAILTELAAERSDAGTLNNLAIAQVATGRIEPALATLDRARQAEPGYARTYENLSFALLQAERFEEARAAAEQALALAENRVDSWNNLGVALFSLGRPGEAQAAFERVLALDPSRVDALFQLGVAAAEAGDLGRAAEALRGFLARSGGASDARRQVAADLLRRLGS